MEYRELASTGVRVSALALGTMTFGRQSSAAQAHTLLDRAVDAGITLIDTAEMYPSPAQATTYGESERIIGRWLGTRGGRERILVATKAAGPAAFVPWIRGGRSRHTAANLTAALDGSLERLGTDYVDLFQLHWPDRAANFFGQLGFKPAREESDFSIEQTLRALDAMVRAGKVRHVGVCNETPWGVMEFLRCAREAGLPPVVSIQNPYNLLNRSLEVGLAEIAWRERCGLLAYSPLAFGTLTGKYLDDPAPPGARLTRYSQYGRYASGPGRLATRRYVDLARAFGVNPAHMALAFIASKPYVTSVIIGATTIAQLDHNLGAGGMKLPGKLLRAIEDVHQEISNPCP